MPGRALRSNVPRGHPPRGRSRLFARYTAMRYGVDPKAEELVSRFILEMLIDRRVAGFSGGELRRIGLGFRGQSKTGVSG